MGEMGLNLTAFDGDSSSSQEKVTEFEIWDSLRF
jgi:hypothetical protein